MRLEALRIPLLASCLLLPACNKASKEQANAPATGAPTQSTSKEAPATDTVEARAKKLVDLMNQGDYQGACKDFDATMREKLPPDKVQETWKTVTAQAGAFRRQSGTRVEKISGYDLVYVICEFANATLDAKISFDSKGQVAGLFFAPSTKKLTGGKIEHWLGTLKVGVTELRLAIHLAKQADGSYQATLDSLDQGAKDLPIDEVTIKDRDVHLSAKNLKATFDGKLNAAGDVLEGQWKQGASSLPLTLKRVDKISDPRRPQMPKKPFPYAEEEVTYNNAKAGIKLAGTLTRPEGQGPFPAVRLITGSGPQDRDETIFGHKPFLVISDYLTRRGLAVLRVDDRGVGGSTGKTSESTTADFAEDVKAGIEFLKKRKEIDPTQIGLIGHSEGGIIAPLVASQSKDVAFIILLAGTGISGEDILYVQGEAIMKVMGATKDQLAMQRSVQQRLIAIAKEEKDVATAEKKMAAVLKDLVHKLTDEEKKAAEEFGGLQDAQSKALLSPWFRYFLTYDPRPALRKVQCPVLALNGEKDLQVPPSANLPEIEKALKEGGNKDFTLKVIPNVNHLFQTSKTGSITEYGRNEETIAPIVLETMADWISRHTRTKTAAAH